MEFLDSYWPFLSLRVETQKENKNGPQVGG